MGCRITALISYLYISQYIQTMRYKTTFLFCFVIFAVTVCFAQSTDTKQPVENLVFEGAGIRGIAYSGVIKQLEERNIMQGVKKVGGTSAGAITALMLSLGYTSGEIYSIVSATEFQKFNDGEMMFVGGLSRLKKRFGWYKGDAFISWLEKIISDKTGNANITFKELEEEGFKQLYVTATCLNRQKLLVFSADTYPEMKIKDAVRISMSVPLYFEAVFIDSGGRVYKKPKKHKDLDVVVDGGIIGNFPIFMFDSTYIDAANHKARIPNLETLGIRIDTDEQIENDAASKELVALPINNLGDYVQAFYILALENLNRNQLTDADWQRTISISSAGIGPKIKKLSDTQKQALIKSGEQHTRAFFENEKIQPVQ